MINHLVVKPKNSSEMRRSSSPIRDSVTEEALWAAPDFSDSGLSNFHPLLEFYP